MMVQSAAMLPRQLRRKRHDNAHAVAEALLKVMTTLPVPVDPELMQPFNPKPSTQHLLSLTKARPAMYMGVCGLVHVGLRVCAGLQVQSRVSGLSLGFRTVGLHVAIKQAVRGICLTGKPLSWP